MRAAIHNPYLDTLGGGERYTLSLAKVLIEKGYQVDIEWKNIEIIKQLESRFGMSLKDINVVSDIKRGNGYDLCFWVSDGSVPSLLSRKNILHFQFPFQGVNGKSLLNKMKLFRINNVVCNSEFTKTYIDKEYGTSSLVIYPPVDTISIKPKRKENIILYVGRFSRLTQSKRQDVLIRAFKKLVSEGVTDWKLVLAGGVEVGVDDYFENIKKESQGFPIEIIPSPDFKTLKDMYGKAKIFWSASGFGEDVSQNPTRVEHFGINIVEAMSAGVVPIVYNAGGHTEIIKDGENGFLWRSEEALLEITKKLIGNKHTLRQISLLDTEDCMRFSRAKFQEKFNLII